MFNQKMRLIPSLQDILLNANVNWQSPDFKKHKLFKEKGFENYRGKVKIDNVIFNSIVRVGKAKFGDVFYDINLEVDQYLPHTDKDASDINRSTSDDSIPNSTENVNDSSKNSLTLSNLNDLYASNIEKVTELSRVAAQLTAHINYIGSSQTKRTLSTLNIQAVARELKKEYQSKAYIHELTAELECLYKLFEQAECHNKKQHQNSRNSCCRAGS